MISNPLLLDRGKVFLSPHFIPYIPCGILRSGMKRLNWFQNSKFLGQLPCIGFQVVDEPLTLSPIFFLIKEKNPTKHDEPTDISTPNKQLHFLPTTKKSRKHPSLSQTKQMAPNPQNKMTHTLKVLETWSCLRKILSTLSAEQVNS